MLIWNIKTPLSTASLDSFLNIKKKILTVIFLVISVMNLNNIRRQVIQKQVQISLFYFKLSSLITVHSVVLIFQYWGLFGLLWNHLRALFLSLTSVKWLKCITGTSKQAVPGTQLLKCYKVLSSFFESRLSPVLHAAFADQANLPSSALLEEQKTIES